MSVETTRNTLEAYAAAVIEGGDYTRYFTDDVSLTLVGSDQIASGRRAVQQMLDYLQQEAFDLEVVLKNLVCGESGAAVEADFIGTHKGEFAGIAPTGRRVNLPYVVVYDVRDDGISALRLYMPMHLMHQQLGVPPANSAMERR